jgi:hypothetical protein
MTQHRVPWLVALLPLLAMGAAWAAEAPAPAEAVASVDGIARTRAEIASLFESALLDCARAMESAAVDPQGRAGVRGTFAHMSKRLDMEYPYAEVNAGNQAILRMVTLVDSLGNPRFAHVSREVTSSKNDNQFGPLAVQALRRTPYTPATRGGTPVATWASARLNFYIKQQGRMGNILSEDKLNEYVAKAREGDGNSQAVVAYLDSIAHEEVGIPAQDQYHFLATAATNGERNALLQVTRLLGATECRPPADVDTMLYSFAMRGRSDLELLHATRMIGRGTLDGHPEVAPMLHGAANSNDAFVQMWAAGMLATAPIDSLRDPQAALESAKTLKVDGDPDAGETLAAAMAATGNYAEAVKAEAAAIKAAAKLHWNDAFMQQRLAKYKAGQPWVGWLCDCTRLVPEGWQ